MLQSDPFNLVFLLKLEAVCYYYVYVHSIWGPTAHTQPLSLHANSADNISTSNSKLISNKSTVHSRVGVCYSRSKPTTIPFSFSFCHWLCQVANSVYVIWLWLHHHHPHPHHHPTSLLYHCHHLCTVILATLLMASTVYVADILAYEP